MKTSIRKYLLLFLTCFVLSGCALLNDDPENPDDIKCSEELSPVMGCTLDNTGLLNSNDVDCNNIPRPISTTFNEIERNIRDMAETLYRGIAGVVGKIAQLVIILYLIFFGVSVATGIARLETYDIIIRLIKVAIISYLLDPGGGIDFYINIMTAVWFDFPRELINIMISPMINTMGSFVSMSNANADIMSEIYGNAPTGEEGFFMMDSAIALLFSDRAGAFYQALWVYGGSSNWTGVILLFFLLIGIILFFITMARGLWEYILSLLFRAVLIGIGFVFILLSLFKETNHLFFSAWIKKLLTYSLQPVFFFAFLGAVIMIMNISFLDMLEGEEGWVNVGANNYPRNRACYLEYEVEIPFAPNPDKWAWQFVEPGPADPPIKKNKMFVDLTQIILMGIIFIAVMYLCFKAFIAVYMIPELIFAFAPITGLDASDPATDLPRMTGQFGASVFYPTSTFLRAAGPSRDLYSTEYYRYQGERARHGKISSWVRAAAYADKYRLQKGGKAAKYRFRKGWGDYFKN